MKPIKIYVGMALSDAPEEFRTTFHDQLKADLRRIKDVEVLDFYWVSHSIDGGEDTAVYELDQQHVENADLLLAILDYPSLGLGGEMQSRVANGKRLMPFHHVDKKVSRYSKGMFLSHGIELHTYEIVADIISIVATWCEKQR